MLVTRVRFAPGKLHGIALARMVKLQRPEIKILFTALPELEEHIDAGDEFISLPVSMPALREAVDRLLGLTVY